MLSLFLANHAHAQSGASDLHRFRLAEGASDGFAVARANSDGGNAPYVRIGFDYAMNPLTYELIADNGSTETFRPVEHQLYAQLVGGYSFGSNLQIFLNLPLQVLAAGPALDGDAPLLAQEIGRESFGLGDLSLGGRFAILGSRNELFKLALQVAVALPTAHWFGSQSSNLGGIRGNKNAALRPQLIFEIGNEEIHWTSNIGVDAQLGSNADQLLISDRRSTSSLDGTFATSLAWAPWLDDVRGFRVPRVRLVAELYGRRALENFDLAVLGPLETLFGVQAQPANGFWVGAAAGPGIGRGIGTPDFRAVLSLGYQEISLPVDENADSDGDGLIDRIDACPAEPEDLDAFEDDDGCPDTDNDHDAVLDGDDRCPTGAEDRDGFQDEDGCPEPDNDRDVIADVHDECPNESEDRDNFEDANGCPDPDNDEDGVLDENDACPVEPGQPNNDPALNGCSRLIHFDQLRGRIDSLERIEFRNNRADIMANLEAILVEITYILRRNPGILRLRIEGHADNRGPDARNRELAARRAAAVRDWFTRQGIPASRFELWTCGENVPRADNQSERGRQRNRRVEFHVSDPPPPQADTVEGCEVAQ